MLKIKDLEKNKKIFYPLSLKLQKKKVKISKKQLKNLQNDENYEFNNILVERHFLFKAPQEVNEQLTKNKKKIFNWFQQQIT